MFTSFFEKKQLRRTLLLSGLAVGAEVIYIILNYFLHWGREYALVGYIIAVLFFIIGWMGANRIGYRHQRQEHNFGPLPAEIVDKKMIFRSPFLAAGLFILLIACAIELMMKFLI